MGLKHALLPVLLLASAGALAQIPDPLKADPKDWLTYSGQYHSQRHSGLKQITAANVGRLQAKWVYHTSWGGQKPDGMPIWVSGSYDSDLNLIYYGTGQPEPQPAEVKMPGGPERD